MGKTKFTPELFDSICTDIANSSRGLTHICAKHDISRFIFYKWINDDSDLYNKYARAKEIQADYMADEIISISDDGSFDKTTNSEGREVTDYEHIQRSKLRVDARKWLAAKLAPRKYSEKTMTETHVTEQPLFPEKD